VADFRFAGPRLTPGYGFESLSAAGSPAAPQSDMRSLAAELALSRIAHIRLDELGANRLMSTIRVRGFGKTKDDIIGVI
jgi:hypothetical protein